MGRQYLTPFIAENCYSMLNRMQMEEFHRSSVETVEDILLGLFPDAGCQYHFKETVAWVYPKLATMGIPTTICLN